MTDCIYCESEPTALPPCPCSHAPCVHDKNVVPCAAVALIERAGKLVVVWNKRYGRWAMPGGKVEVGETPDKALAREVAEETGMVVRRATLLFEGPHGESVESTRGSYVYVFRVEADGYPIENETGCPVGWFTREEFLKWGLAPKFYQRVFAVDR